MFGQSEPVTSLLPLNTTQQTVA